MRSLAAPLLLCVLAGCGDDPIAPGTASSTTSAGVGGAGGAAGCAPGELLVDDGTCRAAGLPPDWSEPPGAALPSEDDVGVPATGCADGFLAHDHGCEPVLPGAPCPPGELAIPGEDACHPVADCGAAPWGAIPVDATTQYVDAAFVGTSDGSAAQPWTSVQQAVDAALPGAVVAIAAGDYVGDVVVGGKPVVLWGRCPELVTLVGVGDVAALSVGGAPGTEVHDLGVEGTARGIDVDGSPGTLLDRVWVHDTGFTGVRARGASGEPIVVSRSLVEASTTAGIGAIGVALALNGVVIRDVNADASYGSGNGLRAFTEGGVGATVTVARSVIERCVEAAVAVVGSAVALDGSVVRDTAPRPTDGGTGWGLGATDDAGLASSLTLTRCLVERNVESGVRVYGSHLELDSTVVRSTAPAAATLERGIGVEVDRDPETGLPGSGAVRHCLVDDSYDTGVLAASASMLVESTRVRDTKPQASDQTFGEGVAAVQITGTGVRAALTVRDSIVEDSHNAGIYVELSDAVLERDVVRDTKPNPAVPALGYGVFAESGDGFRSKLEMRDCLVERSVHGGILLRGADATVDRVRVDGALPDQPDGGGEGIDARADSTQTQATELTLTRSAVERVRAAGLFLAGAHVTVDATRISQVRAIAGDPFGAAGLVVAPPPSQLPTSASFRWSLVEEVDVLAAAVLGASVSFEGVALSAAAPDTGEHGHCLEVSDADGAAAEVTVRGSRIEDCGGAAILVSASQLDVDGTLVRRVHTRADGLRGRGIDYQQGARGAVSACAIEDTHDAGLIALDSEVDVIATSIARTSPDGTGAFGDGLAGVRSTLRVDACRVEDSARAAIAAFGGHTELSSTTLECNPIAIDSEVAGGAPAELVDGGGNVCGCEGETEACKVLSTSLAPPEPLEPAEGP